MMDLRVKASGMDLSFETLLIVVRRRKQRLLISIIWKQRKKRWGKVMKNELLVALIRELYFVKFIINPEQDDVEPGVVLGWSFLRLAKGIVDFGNKIKTIYPDLDSFNDDSDDDWEAVLESVDVSDLPQLDLKLDGEVELEEEATTKEVIRAYKALREKNDLRVFVLPIRLEAKFYFHTLADTGSNINVMPYEIYKKLDREEVKPVNHEITMLNYFKAEAMGILKDVLYQVAKVKKAQGKSDNDGEEGYCVKRDETRKPIYGPNFAKYLNCDDPMNRALALLEALNPFRKIYVWKKAVAFLGLLPGPLQHVEWIPNYSDNFSKNVMGIGNGT
nr:hypothetical protein [Tanacetum cinerariifolium]